MGALLAALLGGAAFLNTLAVPRAAFPYPPPDRMRLSAEDAVLNSALLSLGMRRLAADISFIHLMIYYGTPESRGDDENGGGFYPELGPRALRTLDLDPFFSYPVLYAAGALAFNLNRPAEALDLLRSGLAAEPKNWKYLAYIGAVGFSKQGDPEGVLRELAPVLGDPECPTMLKNMAAFLSVRLGRREDAARLYREILNSRDPGYRGLARRALERLGVRD